MPTNAESNSRNHRDGGAWSATFLFWSQNFITIGCAVHTRAAAATALRPPRTRRSNLLTCTRCVCMSVLAVARGGCMHHATHHHWFMGGIASPHHTLLHCIIIICAPGNSGLFLFFLRVRDARNGTHRMRVFRTKPVQYIYDVCAHAFVPENGMG